LITYGLRNLYLWRYQLRHWQKTNGRIIHVFQALEDQHLTIEYLHKEVKHTFEVVDNQPNYKGNEITILVSLDGQEAVIDSEKLSNELLIIFIRSSRHLRRLLV